VTRSRILNHLRHEHRHQTGRVFGADATTGTGTIERLADTQANALEQVWDNEWEKNLTDAAINRVKRRVPVEQFQLFDFYVLRERPVGEVAKLFGVSAARVYLAKHRISHQIQAELRKLESTPI
jgi:RNA polymerase sigma-70 factor (ECF subfamily)